MLWTTLNKLDSRVEVSFLMWRLQRSSKFISLLKEGKAELGILEDVMCVSACVWPVSMLITILLSYMLRKNWGRLGRIAEEGVWCCGRGLG